ncbi:MAG: hypothetical protein WBR26_11135 [Candidatus Acidiferrum sp.]
MKTTFAMLSALFALNAAAQTRPETHTVEILSAEETHWTTTLNDPGSPGTGTTKTDCWDYGGGVVSCSGTTTTSGATPPSSTAVQHTRVDILVRMPDGNEVKMQCHIPPRWALCSKPPIGPYQAKIDTHSIRIPFEIKGRPDYNKDGTIKKPGKVEVVWVKFSFE